MVVHSAVNDGKLKCSVRLPPKDISSLVLWYPQETQGKNKNKTLGDSALINLRGTLEIFKTLIYIFFPHFTERETQ